MSKRNVSVKDFTVPAITKNGTLYTDAYLFDRMSEKCAAVVSSTAGSITITQQVSYDGNTFFDAYDTTGALLGKICESMGETSSYVNGKMIVFTPIFAKYMRFKIVEQNIAATTVAIKLLMGEEL
jgi:hypothetical protein